MHEHKQNLKYKNKLMVYFHYFIHCRSPRVFIYLHLASFYIFIFISMLLYSGFVGLSTLQEDKHLSILGLTHFGEKGDEAQEYSWVEYE